MKVTCIDCGESREIGRIRKEYSGRCQICAQKFIKTWKPNVRHFRLCHDCGDCKEVRSANAAKAPRCRKCTDIHKYKDVKPLYRVCNDCGDKRLVKSQAATEMLRCADCDAKYRHENKIEKAPAKPRVVQPSLNEPEKGDSPATVQKKKLMGTKKPKPKKASQAAIEKAVQLNREHREFIDGGEKPKDDIPEQKISDDDMIAKWLLKNTPQQVGGSYVI